ncbi:MAG: tyrosine--tRNA ligase [Anaerolineales bacterium]|nr:tyrosine--tRNA ligase [Anaerolineales bacterium]
MNIEEQVELLMQGTEYGDEELKNSMTRELRERLLLAEKEKRPLRIYCGYDPTSTDLHLGHTISMRKLRQFQDLGHDVTFLIGSYTALVGDPSDKNKARPILTEEKVAENALTYAEQAFRVLDREKTKIRYNGEWLSKLTLVDLIRLGQNFTVQQFLARENFAKRLEKGEPIYLHETFMRLCRGMMRWPSRPMCKWAAPTNCSTSLWQGASCRSRRDKSHWSELSQVFCPVPMAYKECPSRLEILSRSIQVRMICLAS